jgi:hypothetical protein
MEVVNRISVVGEEREEEAAVVLRRNRIVNQESQ